MELLAKLAYPSTQHAYQAMIRISEYVNGKIRAYAAIIGGLAAQTAYIASS